MDCLPGIQSPLRRGDGCYWKSGNVREIRPAYQRELLTEIANTVKWKRLLFMLFQIKQR